MSVKVSCSRIRNVQSQTKWSDIGLVGGLSSFAIIQEQIQYLPCHCSKQLLWLNSPSDHIVHVFNSAWLELFNAYGPSGLTLKQMIYEGNTFLNKLHYGPIISTRTQTKITISLLKHCFSNCDSEPIWRSIDPFIGVTHQISCVSDTYSMIHKSSKITDMK